VSSNLTIPNPRAKNGGSTVEGYGDTGRNFNNAENDTPYTASNRGGCGGTQQALRQKTQLSYRP